MAYSKNIHMVHQSYGFQLPVNPDLIQVQYIDLAVLLSEKFGFMVRQGHSFRIVGISGVIQTQNVGDFDEQGTAVSTRVSYCPVTRHSVDAWRRAFQSWGQYRRLQNTLRDPNDDFEVAWDQSGTSLRTSQIRAQGIGDTTAENFVLYGDSLDGQAYSLQDQYNSSVRNDPIATDAFTNTQLKDVKYINRFPAEQHLSYNAVKSNVVIAAGADAEIVGANAHSTETNIRAGSHISCLAGVLKLEHSISTYDADVQGSPTYLLTTMIQIEGWSPLARKQYVAMPRSYSPKTTFTPRKKYYGKKKKKKNYRRSYWR